MHLSLLIRKRPFVRWSNNERLNNNKNEEQLMTSIYRTAYPHFHPNQKLRSKELEADYSLTHTELNYIKENIRGDSLRLGFAVLLKVFQRGFYQRIHIFKIL